ncbi:hypothetical protein [Haloarchaeobius sp. DT45]|uniref:hypothetical protein n=1 Tax=Haloarchaeobius sp. DT45 TaxID=3446116 RepID=UPI003F6CB6A6
MANKLSRRQVLAGLGTIGVASAGAGLGTTAFFSDTEELEGWYEAGRVDLVLDYRSTYKPWERYDLQMVPADQRPAVVAGTDGMTYEIAAAPAVRDENGDAVTHQQWANLVTGNTDLFADVCNLPDTTDISAVLEQTRFTTVSDGNVYRPGFVDGERGMFVDLDDIKPYDEGETTFSFHLCGNPSYIYAELLNADSFEDYREGVDSPTEPEVEAGEVPGDEDDPRFEGGELCDYLYVVVSTDPDCDNLSPVGSEEDIVNPFGTADEAGDVLYAGSMSGWVEQFGPELDGRIKLPPVVKADGSGVAGDPDVAAACFEPGVHCYVMNWYLPCMEDDADRLGFTDLPIKNVLVNGEPLSQDQDGDEALTFNDELRARGYIGLDDDEEPMTLSANITQTDACHVGMKFTAEQCRHNTCAEAAIDLSTGVAEWNVSVAPDGEPTGAAQSISTHPAWIDPQYNAAFDSTASWVNHVGGAGTGSYPAGQYVYETEFEVSPANVGGTCTLEFDWSADNQSDIVFSLQKTDEIGFNMVETAAYTTDMEQFKVMTAESFDITEAGTYRLSVAVENNVPAAGPSPTGLLVSGGLVCQCE